MRLDFGIIWEHGMPHIDDVLGILRQYKDLELVWFKEYTPVDFTVFIDQVYGLDTVPLEHLRAKNEYLKTVGTKTYLMLIKNNKPEPKLVGSGQYQHEQCMLINRFKWQVREAFNPKIDGQRSENHMIHCSDYPEQTDKFLKLLNLGDVDYWCNSKTPELPLMPYHLERAYNYKIMENNTSDLLVNLCYRDDSVISVPIIDSWHYMYVKGIKQPYIDYWNKWKGIRLTEDHTPEKFDEMINWFNAEEYKKMGKFIITKGSIILDGVHRASILASNYDEKIITMEINGR